MLIVNRIVSRGRRFRSRTPRSTLGWTLGAIGRELRTRVIDAVSFETSDCTTNHCPIKMGALRSRPLEFGNPWSCLGVRWSSNGAIPSGFPAAIAGPMLVVGRVASCGLLIDAACIETTDFW